MWKKLACGVSIACFLVAFNLSTIMNSYPANIRLIKYHSVEIKKPKAIIHNFSNFQSDVHEINGNVIVHNFSDIHSVEIKKRKPIIHNFSNFRSDVYDINGDVRIHGNSSTVFVASNQKQNWTIKPYAQRLVTIMRNITEFTIKTDAPDKIPPCSRNVDIPAIVLSGRAHADNHFHAFADVLFPLFLTSNQFDGNVIFLVTYQNPLWLSAYELILKKLSKFDVVNIDEEHRVLCFTRMVVGLKSPVALFVSPNESTGASVGGFAKFVRRAYSLPRDSLHGRRRQPRMLIISRDYNRKLINEHEILHVARGLGFDAVLSQLFWNVSLTAELVNTFDVMVGVHGAGLTNMVFLPENAVLVQITPYGVDVESRICFEWPGTLMNLRYLEYKVTLNESSLLEKFPVDSVFIRDPETVKNRSYGEFHSVYLTSQDLNLDLDRFKKTLLRVWEILDSWCST